MKESAEPKIPRNKFKRLINIISSFLLVVVCSILLGAFLGIQLDRMVRAQGDAAMTGTLYFLIKLVTFSGSVIALAKSIKKITEYLEKLRAHWIGLEPLHLGFREMGVASSFLLIAALIFFNIYGPLVCSGCTLIRVVDREQRIYPFFYEENAARIEGDWVYGVELSEEQKKSIIYIVEGLSSCASAAGRDSVHVEVAGFASYSYFMDNNRSINRASDSLNVTVAHMRRDTLIHYINLHLDAFVFRPKIRVDTVHWMGYNEMMENRPFRDSVDRPGSEHLTRVAELRLISAGACEVIIPRGNEEVAP